MLDTFLSGTGDVNGATSREDVGLHYSKGNPIKRVVYLKPLLLIRQRDDNGWDDDAGVVVLVAVTSTKMFGCR